jgi:hypothetical protein
MIERLVNFEIFGVLNKLMIQVRQGWREMELNGIELYRIVDKGKIT